VSQLAQQLQPEREWRETWPPVALHKSDPRYWHWKGVFPPEVHCETNLGMLRGIQLDNHFYECHEWNGRYWRRFRNWHYIMDYNR